MDDVKTTKLLRFALFFCAIPAFGQVHLHFGVAAGVPVTDTLTSSSSSYISGTYSSFDRYNSITKRLVVGPVVQLDLTRHFGVEFDALYQRIDADQFNGTSEPGYLSQGFQATSANRWQFPLLFQYKPLSRIYLGAGLAISHIGQSQTSSTSMTAPPLVTSTDQNSGGSLTSPGITIQGGVNLPLHFKSELRYSHWFANEGYAAYLVGILSNSTFVNAQAFVAPASQFPLKPNELTFLLSWTH